MNEIPKPGQRVIFVGDHPWSGHAGTVAEYETDIQGDVIGVVHLDNPNGHEAGFYEPSEVELLNQ